MVIKSKLVVVVLTLFMVSLLASGSAVNVVESDTGDLEVNIIHHDDEVVQGEEVSVEYEVSHHVYLQETKTIELAVNGELKDSQEVTLGTDYLLWRHDEHNGQALSVFYGDGVVYSGGVDGSVVAFDVEDEEKLWMHKEHNGQVRSLFYNDGVIYSGGVAGSVAAFDVEDEEKLWTHNEHKSSVHSVFYADGVIYSGGDGSVVAFDVEDEEKLWTHNEHKGSVNSVYYAEGVIYSGGVDGSVVAFDVEDEEKIWTHNEHDGDVNSLFYNDGVIYSGGKDATVMAYHVENEEKIWIHNEHDGDVNSLFYNDGVVYSGGKDATVMAYHVEDEEISWMHREHDGEVNSLFYNDGVVYSSGDGSVMAVRYSPAAEETYIGEFLVDTGGMEPGEYELEVGIDNLRDKAVVTILERPSLEIELTSIHEGEELKRGDRAVIAFEVTNPGAIQDEVDLEFLVNGEVVSKEENFTVGPGETREGFFIWDVDETDDLDLEIRCVDNQEVRGSTSDLTITVSDESLLLPWWVTLLLLVFIALVFGVLFALGRDKGTSKEPTMMVKKEYGIEEKKKAKKELEEEIESLKKERDLMENNTAKYFYQISDLKEKKDELEKEINELEEEKKSDEAPKEDAIGDTHEEDSGQEFEDTVEDTYEKESGQDFEDTVEDTYEEDIDQEFEYTVEDTYEEERGQDFEDTVEDTHEEEEGDMYKEDAIEGLKRLKGVGTSKAELLYENGYRSIQDLQGVSQEELCRLNGIGPSLSESILESLKELE